MELAIYKDFELKDIIVDFEKLELGRKFRGVGRFKLVLKNMEHADTAKVGSFIFVKDKTYLITDFLKYKNLEQQEEYHINGYHIDHLLSFRVTQKEYEITKEKTYEEWIRIIVSENFISTSSERKMPGFELGQFKKFKRKPTVNFTLKKDKISKIINQLCSYADLGYNISCDFEKRKFIFDLFEEEEKLVFFSEEYGNAANSELKVGEQGANVCYHKKGVKGSASGINRIETIVEGEEDKATEELRKGKVKEVVQSDILNTEQFEYGKDWDLGSIVTFFDKSIGFVVKKPVLEIKEIYTKRFDLEVIFGEKEKIMEGV